MALTLIETSADYEIIRDIKNKVDELYQENLGNQFIYINHTFKFGQYIKDLIFKEHINHPLIQKLNDDIRYDICNTIYKNNEYLKNSSMEITFERNGEKHKFKFGFIITRTFDVFDTLLKNDKNKILKKRINHVLKAKYTNFTFMYYLNNSTNEIETYLTIYNNVFLSYRIVLKIAFSIDNVQAIQNMKKEDYSTYKNNIFKFSFWKCTESKNYPVDIREKYFDEFVFDLLNNVIKEYNKYFLNIIIQTHMILDSYKN